MSVYDQQHQAPASYPSAVTAYPPPLHQQAAEGYASGPNVAPPPPVGYPTVEGSEYPQQNHPVENTKSRGDDFWKGCFAALCCCCVLDFCCC